MIHPLNPGDTVPQFTLPDQDGGAVSLSDYSGQQVLIYFYPKAMTPGCTVQACNLRDHIKEFNAYNVAILGISADTPEKLNRFTERDLLNFPLLADQQHEIAELFGVWGEKKFMGKTYNGIHRISFLVDTTGKIKARFSDFKTSNHHEVILDYLKQQATE